MFRLIDLPFPINELGSIISANTLAFHHGKHLRGYVDNLNRLLPGTPFDGMTLEEIVCKSKGAIFNNAGQVLNHNLYFEQFSPAPKKSEPTGSFLAQIEKQWGDFAAFKKAFVAAGVSLFGSGWVWLSADKEGSLLITQEPGANNPITKGLRPLLTFDVWEHAYYLDYQNRRADHLAALWNIIDWQVVEDRYAMQERMK